MAAAQRGRPRDREVRRPPLRGRPAGEGGRPASAGSDRRMVRPEARRRAGQKAERSDPRRRVPPGSVARRSPHARRPAAGPADRPGNPQAAQGPAAPQAREAAGGAGMDRLLRFGAADEGLGGGSQPPLRPARPRDHRRPPAFESRSRLDGIRTARHVPVAGLEAPRRRAGDGRAARASRTCSGTFPPLRSARSPIIGARPGTCPPRSPRNWTRSSTNRVSRAAPVAARRSPSGRWPRP